MSSGSSTSGSLVSQRFRLVRRLGEGGMGVVYEAVDTERNARVALKTVRTMTAESLARFKREFRAVQDVHHQNLATIGELVTEGDRWFFTMELVEGEDFLAHVCASVAAPSRRSPHSPEPGSVRALGTASTKRIEVAKPFVQSRFDEDRLRAALVQLANGLGALHGAGLVHRDIKPSNIRVTPEGRVVLLDFGLVSAAGAGRDTTDQNVVGTPVYMAPEQAASKPVGPPADWYSVGVLLYEIFTGAPPIEGSPLEVLLKKQQYEPPPPSALASGVPPDLDDLCAALLRFDPEARPTTAQVLRALGAPVDPAAARSHSQTANVPFVGRAPELDMLAEAYRKSRDAAQSVLVHGESGVGKSCLVKRFVDVLSLEVRDLVVLTGRCYEREAVPYKAFDGIVDAITRYLRRLPGSEAAAMLPTKPGPLAQLFPVLRRVPAIASQTRDMAPAVLDPLELRSRAFAGLRDLLTRLSDRRPLVLVIDDLQWAGADSLALLAEVLRPPEAPNMLVVATVRTTRNEGGPRFSVPGAVRTIELDRLSTEQSRELATVLLQRATLGRADAEAIVEEAEGHPLFIDALVRHAMIVQGEALESVHLEEALWSRVKRLEEPMRRLMELLACAGAPIEQDVLVAASDSDRSDFPQQIAFLRVAHLASISGGRGSDTIEPYHDKVRAAVVANLDEATRRECHRRLAIALETSARADAEALATHWQRAGEPARGAKFAVKAAEQASEALAFDRAANLYALALELTPTSDPERRALSSKLGDAFRDAGRGALAAAAYRDAAVGTSGAVALDLRRRAAEQLLRGGHFEEGLVAIAEVLDAIGLRLPSSPLTAVLWLLFWRLFLRIRGLGFRERDPGQVTAHERTTADICRSVADTMSLSDFIVGAAYQGRALSLALRTGDPYRIARALALEIGYVAAGGGPNWRRTQALIERASQLAEQSGRPDAIAWVAGATGLAHMCVGQFAECVDHVTKAREIFVGQCTGVAWEIDTVQALQIQSLMPIGRLTEVAEMTPRYLRDALDRGDLYGAVNMRTGWASMRWLVTDDPEGCLEECKEAMRVWPKRGFHIEHYNALLSTTFPLLYLGRAQEAHDHLSRVWPELARSQLLRVENIAISSRMQRAHAAVAAASMATESAHRSALLARAEADARALLRTRMPYGCVPGNMTLAAVDMARRGRASERTIGLLREAVRTGDACLGLWSTAARHRLGSLLGGEEGKELVNAADTWMTGQGVKRPDKMYAMLAPGFEA